jgi:IS5 family transposase
MEGLMYSLCVQCYGSRSTESETHPMLQQTLSGATVEQYPKPPRRERFLDEMNHVVLWVDLVALIEPGYPKAEGLGRPPVSVERLLQLHRLQHSFTLWGPVVENARYNSHAMRQFVGIDLGSESVPDEMTICKFRHRLEACQIGAQLFAGIRQHLVKHGVPVSRGTIFGALLDVDLPYDSD